MKKLTLAMMLLAASGSMMAQSSGSKKTPPPAYNNFIPVGPAPIDYKIADGRLMSEVTTAETNNERAINLLPNELLTKTILVQDDEGTMNFSVVELSAKKSRYIVTTDYIKYTTLPVRKDAESGNIIGVARVGVGLRIEATFIAKSKNINVTDLYQIGIFASSKKLQGSVTVSVMGIESEEITTAFPINAEISPTSITEVLLAMETVKQAIYDPDTHLTPQVLEIKYTEEYRNGVNSKQDLAMPILLPNRANECVVIR